MLSQLFTSPIFFLNSIIALVIAVTIHEFAHAWVADRLGDPTPRLAGRLNLNPLSHLDPLGTLMLLVARFGWGKPVPVDSFNLKNPRRDTALVSLAGPMSNFILASLLAIPLKSFILPPLLFIFLSSLIIINISLGVFNLLPIPPLDGSKILFGFLPERQASEWESLLNQYSSILLILLIIPFGGSSFASRLIGPIINFVLSLLLPGPLFV